MNKLYTSLFTSAFLASLFLVKPLELGNAKIGENKQVASMYITGTVRVLSNSEPMSQVVVQLTKKFRNQSFLMATAITDNSGIFTFGNVEPGMYAITPVSSIYSFNPQSYEVRLPKNSGESFDFSAIE